jgi:hypothetical protein
VAVRSLTLSPMQWKPHRKDSLEFIALCRRFSIFCPKTLEVTSEVVPLFSSQLDIIFVSLIAFIHCIDHYSTFAGLARIIHYLLRAPREFFVGNRCELYLIPPGFTHCSLIVALHLLNALSIFRGLPLCDKDIDRRLPFGPHSRRRCPETPNLGNPNKNLV